MIAGGNGKGKSTLLYNLHPGAGSNDPKRKTLTLEGKDARKEIDIQDGDKFYEIVHLYPAKGNTKSFIDLIDQLGVRTKLNPNGGVGTFNDILERELGFTNDFFKVGRIAPDNNNFIDMISSERKKYVSKFLPDIDCYLKIYETASDKLKFIKKELTVLSDLIQRLGNKDSLEQEFAIKSSFIENTEKTIDELNAEYNKMQGFKDSVDADGTFKNGNPVTRELSEISSEIDSLEDKVLSIKTKIPALSDFDLGKTNDRIAANSVELETYKNTLNDLKMSYSSVSDKINNLRSTIVNKQDQLGTFIDTGKSEDELRTILSDLKTKIDDSISILTTKSIEESEKISNFEYRHIDAARIRAAGVYEELMNIRNDFSHDVIELVVTTLSQPNINVNNIDQKAAMFVENLKHQNQETERKKSFIEKRYERFVEASKLSCPSGAKCPHWQSVQKFSDFKSDIEDLTKESNKQQDLIANAEENASHLAEVKKAAVRVFKAYDSIYLNKLMNLTDLKKYIISIQSFCSLLKVDRTILPSVFSFDSVIAFINARDNIDEYKSKYALINSNLESLLKNKEAINKINNNISDLNNEINILDQELISLKDQISTCEVNINSSNRKVVILNELKELFDRIVSLLPRRDELTGKFAEYELKFRTYKEYDQKQQMVVAQLSIIKPELIKARQDLDVLKINISKFDEYSKSYKMINENLEKLTLVKNSVDPVKGIPVYLTQEYLKDILSLCNDLLDIAYNGSFRLTDFNITEKEFSIPVTKNGKPLKDICEASQGETSLTKIALSFAMFCQVIKKYDVLYLDEADGPLDHKNKKIFMEILDKQIQELKLQQIFVISHSDEFYSSEVSLILFPEHTVDLNDETFMVNKTLIASL